MTAITHFNMQNLCLQTDLAEHLDLKATSDSALVAKMVTRCSAFFLKCINQDTLYPTLVIERRNGNGIDRICPRRSPVLQFNSLTINNIVTPPAPTWDTSGWFFDKYTLYLSGSYALFKGIGNIYLNYLAGYGQIATETFTISDTPYVVANSVWYAMDVGVTGFTAVTASPATKQYSVTSDGTYTFNIADVGTTVTISYWYATIPVDIQDAVIDICSVKYKRRKYIDIEQQTTGGENIVFSQKDIADVAKRTINNYMSRGFMNG